MFMDAVKQRLAQMGLEPVAVRPSQGLERSRQDSSSTTRVLKRPVEAACAQEFTQMAADDHVDAFIVLVPGVNDSDHAGSARRKDLPEYLRGWGYVTKAEQPGAKPTVFDMTQVLLVSATGGTALLRAREFGGAYTDDWSLLHPAGGPQGAPAADLDSLKPVVSGLLTRQSNRVFDQIEVVRRARRALRLGHFDDPAVAVHSDPVAGLDDRQRVLIELRDGRHAHDHRAERDLGRHLIEDQRLRGGARESREVEGSGPAGGAFGARETPAPCP